MQKKLPSLLSLATLLIYVICKSKIFCATLLLCSVAVASESEVWLVNFRPFFATIIITRAKVKLPIKNVVFEKVDPI